MKTYYMYVKNLEEVLQTNDQKAEILMFIDTLNIILRKNPDLFEVSVKDFDKFCFLIKIILYYMETDHYELFGKPFCGRQFIKDNKNWCKDLRSLPVPIDASRYTTGNTFAYPNSSYFTCNMRGKTLLFEQFGSADKIRYFDQYVNKDGYTDKKKLEPIMYPHLTYDYSDFQEYLSGYDVEGYQKKFNMIAELRKMYTGEGIIDLIDSYKEEAMYKNASDGYVINLENALNRTKSESIKSLL